MDTLYIVEELEPVIEEQVKSWGIQAIGKEIFTVQGEYSANMLRRAILGQEVSGITHQCFPGSCMILVAGHTGGGIIQNDHCSRCLNLHGMEKAKGKDYVKNWVAVIGDSTFLHTGVNSLMNMVYNTATASRSKASTS